MVYGRNSGHCSDTVVEVEGAAGPVLPGGSFGLQVGQHQAHGPLEAQQTLTPERGRQA